MLDPFRLSLPSQIDAPLVRFANAAALPSLPQHAHEVLFAIGLYSFTMGVVSPAVSNVLVPKTYKGFDSRTRISWDIHFVSFVQACIVNALSFYLIFYDEERKAWRGEENWEKRIWGYTGMTGFTQSMALGYFLWDLYMCLRYLNIFGWGMVVHAVASAGMFTFGFRPFIHFWCPVFLLHELSTPFLNIHWFCDKLDLTGSIYQAVNGVFLMATFFGCRLAWGTYGSIGVGRDVYRAVTTGYTVPQYLEDKITQVPNYGNIEDPVGQTTHYMTVRYLPLWLGASYLAANVVLQCLNFFWFSKMVATIRKRFTPPFGTKGVGADKIHYYPEEKKAKAAKKKN
ncbi:DUF887-domain-containing protein [Dissoconium aciculare CBS 342.82]|uniref:DUF887-domain-containing protein n=1 Tax=Dissoconium aciculare CBS 342.82 TaxID=1314786 RepID=A0A6J3MFV9_9PEZI|nr:DUF887-domain-containing protein [Dissoconium aciculare CBS 342.82]KAF1825767.1 DUF887-domain-containing protein [Dissoconium aciculare CBS 342.82]